MPRGAEALGEGSSGGAPRPPGTSYFSKVTLGEKDGERYGSHAKMATNEKTAYTLVFFRVGS